MVLATGRARAPGSAHEVAEHQLSPKFIVVSGKGGVGRTTVAATMAQVAAGAGKRVLIADATAADRLAASSAVATARHEDPYGRPSVDA